MIDMDDEGSTLFANFGVIFDLECLRAVLVYFHRYKENAFC